MAPKSDIFKRTKSGLVNLPEFTEEPGEHAAPSAEELQFRIEELEGEVSLLKEQVKVQRSARSKLESANDILKQKNKLITTGVLQLIQRSRTSLSECQELLQEVDVSETPL